MVDIKTNLLKNRHTLSEKEYEQERKYLRYSVVSLVIVVIIVLALGIWNFILTQNLSKIETSITSASKEMQGLVQASAQQIYLKSRLSLITSFLADKSLTRESLQKVLLTNIDGVHVSGVSFEGETILVVQYTANSAVSLEKLLTYYQADTGYFSQAVSRGLSRAKEGNYQMSIALTLPKGDK